MNDGFDVFTIADLGADIIITGRDVVPEFGQKEKLVDDYTVELGGSCSIFACQTAKLGLKTCVAGRLGNDVFGDLVIAKLEEAGVNTAYIQQSDDIKTGVSIALSKNGDRAILTYTGSMDANSIDDIPWEALLRCKHLRIGSFFLQKTIQPYLSYIAQRAKSEGLSVSLDVNWDPDELWAGGLNELLYSVDIFMPNEEEAKSITGCDTVEEAMHKLAQRIPLVVVKMGEKGAIAQRGSEVYTSRPLDVDIRDTVGAGDSFDGGFIYGYLSGMDVRASLEIANICGGLNTTAYGGIAGQPDLNILNKHLDCRNLSD